MPAKGTRKKNKKQTGKADNPMPFPRSDGQGLRYPVKVRITDDLELDLLNAKGRKLDGRQGIVRQAKKIFQEHIQELGGPGAITARQRRELEIVVRQTLMGRRLSDELFEDKDDLRPFASSNSDRILLTALHRAYQ